MVLGDKTFHGGGLSGFLKTAVDNVENSKETIFGYYVNNPEHFGIMEFDENMNIIFVEEKPTNPRSNYCITGPYFYPAGVSNIAKDDKLSKCGELEIITLNDMYLKENCLKAQVLGRGFAWFDIGTMDGLVEATEFVQITEKRQGVKISAPEEIAYRKGWITREQLIKSADKYGKSPYGEHLRRVADGSLKY